MKTITLKTTTWKTLSLLKLKYDYDTIDELINTLLKGGLRCLEEKRNKTKQ